MFKVTIMTEDKRLPKVLFALDGLVIGPPEVTPVRGAKVRGNKIVSSQPQPGVPIKDQVAHLIHERKLERVNSSMLRELVKEVGGKPASSGSIAQYLRKDKVLGRAKRGEGYPVLNGKA